jgi:hypothetical protein
MIPANRISHLSSADLDGRWPANRLGERLHHYFDRHPDVSRSEFLVEAVQKELAVRDEQAHGVAPAWSYARPQPVTEEDVRIHTWLTDHVLALRPQPKKLWDRVRHVLFG